MAKQRLPLGYRIGWRVRYALVSVFGPAQLGSNDPQSRLRAEKQRRLDALGSDGPR